MPSDKIDIQTHYDHHLSAQVKLQEVMWNGSKDTQRDRGDAVDDLSFL